MRFDSVGIFSLVFVKSQVYENNPQSISALNYNIRDIERLLCQSVIEKSNKRVDVCKDEREGLCADITSRT